MATRIADIARRVDLLTIGIGGASLIASEELKGQKEWYKNVTARVKHFNDVIVPAVLGVVGLVVERFRPLVKMLALAGIMAVKDAYMAFVKKKPFVVAKDASTLELENFDPNTTIEVYIDGKAVSFSTAPTTDANGKATVTLPSPMSEGKHEICVIAGKAFVDTVCV